MKRNAKIYGFFLLAAVLLGCSSKPPASQSKKAAVKLDKIQGKVQIIAGTSGGGDAALNPGGDAVYLWVGVKRYRLFSRTGLNVVGGAEYTVEGIDAQKMIDEIGDPDQGKNGYPLAESCARVITTAWPGLPFDGIDAHASLLRERIARYPARPVFLVVKIDRVPDEAAKKEDADDAKAPIVTVPPEKHRAALVEGPVTLTAPLWEPAGRKIQCKIVIDTKGKVSELETGAQLCEAAPWEKFLFKPLVQGGRPVKVRTAVELTYEPRK
jgi:hypothetical protein